MIELARLGYQSEADKVAEFILNHKTYGDHWGRILQENFDGPYELDGNALILLGLYWTWRMSGSDSAKGRIYAEAAMHWLERNRRTA